MSGMEFVPLAAMAVVIAATLWRGHALRRKTGDRAWAFAAAQGGQRIAVISFAVSLAVMLGAAATAPPGQSSARSFAAALAAAGGALIVLVAQVQMGRAWRVGVRAGDAPVFVSRGLFRFSRNPIFLGMILIGLGAAIGSATGWAWASWLVFIAACTMQVRIEERHLEQAFGDQYRNYSTAVPRWLGWRSGAARSPGRARAVNLIAVELAAFAAAGASADPVAAWRALERAHIISQPYLSLHLQTHRAMLGYAAAQRDWAEVAGQLLRLALAPVGALTGQIPIGNTGRSNVSAFRPMAIPEDLRGLLDAGDQP